MNVALFQCGTLGLSKKSNDTKRKIKNLNLFLIFQAVTSITNFDNKRQKKYGT